ncbi:hypothetical protein PC116_g13075 [Phytophthora cactorum]|nr:hypothetical protein PC116_g13075 [Phytophthora cactorum]
MESVAVSDGLNADVMAQWDSTVQNSVLPKNTQEGENEDQVSVEVHEDGGYDDEVSVGAHEDEDHDDGDSEINHEPENDELDEDEVDIDDELAGDEYAESCLT